MYVFIILYNYYPFYIKAYSLFRIRILYIIAPGKLHYFIMFRLRYKSLTFKREGRLTRVRLCLIFGDFVHFRENFIPPYEKIKKKIKGARGGPLYLKNSTLLQRYRNH